MKPNLLRLGGIAGICAGLSILSFALIDGLIGGLFAREVLRGESADAWLERIQAHPELARLGITLPFLGFSLMLVVALVLWDLIPEKPWPKVLAMAGYLVGVPLAVGTFVSAMSMVFISLDNPALQVADSAALLKANLALGLHRFMIVNYFAGPLFIVVVGNTFISLAALSSRSLPTWLCRWGMLNGALMFIGLFDYFWPVLTIAQIGGPLTMLWFVATGITLLRMAK